MAEESNEKADVKPKAKTSEKDPGKSDDFKYIVRIANTDLDGNKILVQALTKIKGIGHRMARIIVIKTGMSPYEKIGNLQDGDIEKIENYIIELSDEIPGWLMNKQKDFWTGEDIHLLGTEMDTRLTDDINLMKKIRCYRGVRHEKGQKVRGQRTKAHGRSGLSVGVVKKTQQQVQKPATKT